MTAGRCLLAVWSVKGNGTRTTSPNSKLVISRIVGVVPHPRECRFRSGGRGSDERAVGGALAQEVDKALDLGQPLRRQVLELAQQTLARLVAGGHPRAPLQEAPPARGPAGLRAGKPAAAETSLLSTRTMA